MQFWSQADEGNEPIYMIANSGQNILTNVTLKVRQNNETYLRPDEPIERTIEMASPLTVVANRTSFEWKTTSTLLLKVDNLNEIDADVCMMITVQVKQMVVANDILLPMMETRKLSAKVSIGDYQWLQDSNPQLCHWASATIATASYN